MNLSSKFLFLISVFLPFFLSTFLPSAHASFTITAGTVTLTNAIIVDVASDIVIEAGGSLDAGDCLINIGRRFDNSGRFTAGTSTVTFYTTLVSTITGNTTFYCLRSETPAKQIFFTAGSTQTVAGILTLTGALGNLIKLRSTIDGQRWGISFPSRSQEVNFVDVKDSNALLNKTTCYNGLNSGNNNENWVFIQDQGPPAAISNLTALTGTQYDGDVRLYWTAPGNDGTEGDFNGLYRIRWSTNNITNFDSPPYPYYELNKSSYIVALQGQVFTVTGLNPGTTYYFAIKTKDPVDNWSTWSTVGVNTANFAAALDLPPSAPLSVSAIANSSYTVNVSWERPIPTYVDDLDKYFLYRATFVFTSTTTTNVIHIATVTHPTNVYLDTGLTTNVTYYYRIVAYDKGDIGDGLFSAVLNSTVSVIASACPLPTDPAKVRISVVWDNRSSNNQNNYGAVDGIEDADGTVTWDWPFIPDGGTIVNYFIEVSTDKNFSFYISSQTLPPTVSTYTVSNLPRGSYAYARVRAKNSEGITGDWTSSDGIYINRKTVNGDMADWTGTFPTSSNTVTVSGGDALWRDAIGDQRTDRHTSSQLDISSVGITCDEYNLYLFVAFASTVSAGFDGRNFIQIMIDNGNLSTERVFRGLGNKYEDSYVSKYVPWEYLCEIVTGNDVFRVEDNLWTNRKFGGYSESNTGYFYEVAMPLSQLGGREKFLGKTVNFTIATFWNAGGLDGSIGDWSSGTNSNIVDVITSTGPNTWNEVSDRIVDYHLSITFSTAGVVTGAQGVLTTTSNIPDEPEPISNGISPAPPSALDYILYNIFIDAWYNGDSTNNDPTDANSFGGDFQGVIDKVDYLNEMGINVAYFGPPYQFGGGIWGFNIDDPFRYYSRFGGTAKYIEMMKTLRNHNIKIMNDWVCGQVGSPNSPAAQRNPDYYWPELFGHGTKQEFAEARAYYLNNMLWCFSTCDAFRYDNPKFWDQYGFGREAYEFNRALRKIADRWDPQLFIMGEIPDHVGEVNNFTGSLGPMIHGGQDMKGGGYKDDYRGSGHICNWARNPPGKSTIELRTGLNEQHVWWKNEWSINPIMMENHDEHRFISRNAGGPWKQQIGYMTAFTVSVSPILFYGGELGLEGPWAGDAGSVKMSNIGNVRQMPWERLNQSPWNSVRPALARTLQARANFPALRGDPKHGGRSFYEGGQYDGDVLVYARTGWGQKAIVMMNRSAGNVTLTNVPTGDNNTLYKDWLTDDEFMTDASGNIGSIQVNSHYGRILIRGGYDWANVTGTVTNSAGAPVANAIVDIDGKSHWTTRTDSNGYYSLSGYMKKVLTGNRTVRAWAPGYNIVTRTVNITNNPVNNNVSFSVASGYPLTVDNTPPAAPTTLGAKPRDRAAMLFWQPNTEPDIQTYLIYRSLTPIPDGSNPEPIFEVFKTFYYDSDLDNKLINGTTYYYRIRAVDRNGNKSPFSNEVAVVPRKVKVKFWLDTRGYGGTVNSASIAGGALTFSQNYWEPVAMNSNGDGTFERTFEFDDTTFIEYKYIINGNVWEGSAGNLFLDGSAGESNRGELMDDGVPDFEVIDEGNGTMIVADVWRYYYDQPPRAPTGLQITAGPNVLTVGWTRNAEPDLSYYTIYRDDVEIAKVGKDAINYVDVGLVNNTTYSYKITATDTKGNTSGDSSTVSGYPTAADTQAPSQPSGLVAYGAGANGLSGIKIKWNPNYEGDLAGYNLHRSTVSGFSVNTENKLNYTLISPATTQYIDWNITNQTTYYYKLVAVDSSGNASTPSSQLPARLIPVTFEIDMGNINPSNVRIIGDTEPLDWSGSTTTLSYVSGSSWSITLGFIAGTQIQYRYAYNFLTVTEQNFNTSTTNREWTVPYSATLKADDWEQNPDMVSGVKVHGGVNSAYLYWDRNFTTEDLAGYNVYRSVPPSTTPTLKLNAMPLAYSVPYTVTGLAANVTYYFSVKAVDSGSTVLESTAATVVSVVISSPVYVHFGVPWRVGESTSPWGDSSRLKMYVAIKSSADVAVWSTAERADVTNGLLEMTAQGDGTYRAVVPLARSPHAYNFLFFARTTNNPPTGLSPNTDYYDTVPSTGLFWMSTSSTTLSSPAPAAAYFNPAGPTGDARRFLYLPPSLTPGSTFYVFANFGSTPTAPTYIQTVAGNNKITLYWSAPYGAPWTWPPPETIGNVPASSGESMKAVDVVAGGVYQIFVTTYNPGSFASYRATVTVSGETFSYTFSGLTNNVTYYYLMRSSDTFRGLTGNNFSAFSSTVSAYPTSKTVTVKVRVNNTAHPLWKSVRKTIAFQEGITVSAWDAPGRSNLTPGGRAVNLVAPSDDPTEQEFSVDLAGGTTYNFILFAYSTFSITGLQKNVTYYDTVPNSGSEGMWTSTSTVSITGHGKAWYGNVGATGDSRRLLYVPSDLPAGATLYVYCNFSARPTQLYVYANPVSSHSIYLEWIPYGSWGTGGESLKAIDVIAGGFYHLYRSSVSSAGPWVWFASTNTMNWTDEGLVKGTRYYYVVVSSDAYRGSGGTQAQIPNLYRTGAPEFSSADASAVPSSAIPTYFKVDADERKNIYAAKTKLRLLNKGGD